MTPYLNDYIQELCEKLEKEAIDNPENKEVHYTAAKLLRAFNELFAVTWQDVEYAEEMRKDREREAAEGRARK